MLLYSSGKSANNPVTLYNNECEGLESFTINRVSGCLLDNINGCSVSTGSSAFSSRPSALNIKSPSTHGRKLRNVFNSKMRRTSSVFETLPLSFSIMESKASADLVPRSFTAVPNRSC